MKLQITIENSRGYSSEKNLLKGLRRFGLIPEEGKERDDHCRYVICRKPEGSWTAVFLVSEWLNKNGGYCGHFAQRGFVSI